MGSLMMSTMGKGGGREGADEWALESSETKSNPGSVFAFAFFEQLCISMIDIECVDDGMIY